MPYRIDVRGAGDDALDRLVELGAIDAEVSERGGLAALMPDSTEPESVAALLGATDFSIRPAAPRDAGSTWVLSPRAVQIGHVRIVPADAGVQPGDLRLIDTAAFGTGLHPTTALCVEALQDIVQTARPEAVLDIGTGSGVLALAALVLGVPRAHGVDIDDQALRVAAANARLNGLEARLELTRGGPEAAAGTWPLVLANVLAAPLIEMAPAVVRRVGHEGRLALSGIPASAERDVDEAYRHLGMRRVRVMTRAGWIALVMQASW